MRRSFLPGFYLCLFTLLASAQGTEIRFLSKGEEPVFLVKRIYAEEGRNLTSDLSLGSLGLELLTVAPSTITLPEGSYLLNVRGVSNFNRIFPLVVEDKPREVRFLGDPRREILYGLVTIVAGAVIVPAAMALGGDLRAERNPGLGLGLYGTLGGGLLLTLGVRGMVVEYPRVEVWDR